LVREIAGCPQFVDRREKVFKENGSHSILTRRETAEDGRRRHLEEYFNRRDQLIINSDIDLKS